MLSFTENQLNKLESGRMEYQPTLFYCAGIIILSLGLKTIIAIDSQNESSIERMRLVFDAASDIFRHAESDRIRASLQDSDYTINNEGIGE